MTTNPLAKIKRRTPAWAKRAYRRLSSSRSGPPGRGRSVAADGGAADGRGDAERVALLEAELGRERARAQRAELRIDLVRQETTGLRQEATELRERLRSSLDQEPSKSSPPEEVARDGDLPPSFRYKLGEQRRVSRELNNGLGVGEPVWQVNPKLDGREFAERLGVAVPELLAGPVSIHDLDLDALPDHFVIKPVTGHSSRGVFLLHRSEPDRYRSLLDRNESYSRAGLLERYAQWAEKGSIPESVIVERLLFDGSPDAPVPPIDYRFFCFYGEVGFVMARDGHGIRAGSRVRFRFFDDQWNDLGVVRLDIRNDPNIRVPRQAVAMVDAARVLSASIPRPMVRIDLFDADDAAYFGEVTPFPGGNFALDGEHDRRFGEQWERAEARLERDAIAAGIRALRA